jgi:uncharacterized RDD family membrane protein YckC
MTQAPPGWYPDPAPQQPGQPPTQRYWDGQQWTAHVHPPAVATSPTEATQTGPVAPAAATTPYGATPYSGSAPAASGTTYGAATTPLPSTPDGQPLAGWWHRVAAYLIDSIAVGIAGSLLTIPAEIGAQSKMQRVLDRYQHAFNAHPNRPPDFGSFFDDYMHAFGPVLLWSLLISVVVWSIYEAAFFRWKGATPGMMALGIGVRLRERPGRLGWPTLAARIGVQQGPTLLGLLPLVALALWPVYLLVLLFQLLNVLWPLWDSKKQALHDKAARTNVVRTR